MEDMVILLLTWGTLHESNRLIVRKDSEIVIEQDVDDDFIELITKRCNSKKTYSAESANLFKELTEMSSLPMHKTSSKFNKILRAQTTTQSDIEYYNNPTELLDELEIIMGSLKSGNNLPILFNKGIKIIDELIQNGFIN